MLKKLREPVNSLTHWAGAVLALAGLIALLIVGWSKPAKIISLTIYGLSLIAMFSASATYHMVRVKDKALEVFRKIDHSAIYLLIAGTYTPFALLLLKGDWGWWIFGLVWTLAAIGVFKDSVFHRRYRWISYVLYLGMGWLVVFAWKPLEASLPTAGLVWLFVGGVFYTAGLVFLAMAKRVAHTHGVWHICVMARKTRPAV